MRLEFFESLNGITDFLLWKLFGKLFRSKWLFSWVSVRWILRLPDSENDLEHSLQGRGGIVFFKMASPRKWLLPIKWLLPENGFSPENGFKKLWIALDNIELYAAEIAPYTAHGMLRTGFQLLTVRLSIWH